MSAFHHRHWSHIKIGVTLNLAAWEGTHCRVENTQDADQSWEKMSLIPGLDAVQHVQSASYPNRQVLENAGLVMIPRAEC